MSDDDLVAQDAQALETAIKSVTDLLETKLRVIDRELLALNDRRDTLQDLHRQFTTKLNALKGPKAREKAHACDECDKVFTSAQGVIVHKNRSHKKLAVVPAQADHFWLRCNAPRCSFTCEPTEAPLMLAHIRGTHKREPTREERTPRTA